MYKAKIFEGKNIEDILALTPVQEGMLFHYLKETGSYQYFEQLSLDITGEINLEFFEKAWNFVIETNEMLRAVYRWQKVENPVQVILGEYTLKPGYYNLSAKDNREKEKQLEEIKARDRKEKFVLQKREVPFRVILCEVEKNRFEMIISNHHILYDGWSTGIILGEFFNAYHDFFNHKIPVRPFKNKFKEYVKWIKGRDVKKGEKFWQEYLKGFDTPTGLPVKIKKREVNEKTGPESGFISIKFTGEKKLELENFAQKNKVTPASLFYSAWGMLLGRYNNCGDVVFGSTVSGRSANIKGIEKIVGLFINTIPLRMQINPGDKIIDWLCRENSALIKREEYENTPLVEIREHSEIDNREELFNSIVVIENYPLDRFLKQQKRAESGGLVINSYAAVEMTHYDLTVVLATADDIEINFIYNRERFQRQQIESMGRHFHAILLELIHSPRQKAAAVEILSAEEKRRILEDFNDTPVDYPPDKTIHRLFEEQAARGPDNIAAAGPMQIKYRTYMTDMTYKELNEKSARLAYLLKERGAGPDTIVGIMLERSLEMIIGIFGILKAGGAYLPIDADYPEERKQYILKDSGARVFLTLSNNPSCSSCPSWFFTTPQALKNCLKGTPSHLQLAYIVYTSGSTGKPKGVMINHGSAVNVLSALQKAYPFTASGVYLLKTSYVFDVSVAELFGWFFGGGRLAILEKDGEKDPQKILAAIERHCVTHINFVPSMFNVFAAELNSGNSGRLSGLRYIFLAGEALLPGVAEQFRRLNTKIALENIYGPTEGTVYACGYSLSQWDGSSGIPIGKPLQNVRLYILDSYNRLQPVGIPGELFISGSGTARGYLNNPELTAEKFLPLHPSPIYKTGDLCRWLPDGNIEFLGRMDFQVKIRGFRIELGEIENRLLNHNEIKEVVVTAAARGSGDHFLCAYIVPGHNVQGAGPTAAQLREYLSRLLPDYMVPAFFVQLAEMPLTPSGKIDRKALPEPEVISSGEYIAPRGALEETMVETWSEVLGIEKEKIGIDDNFFELGGHSLKASRLTGRIHKKLSVEIPLAQLFKFPTVRQLAHYMDRAGKARYAAINPVEKKEYYELSSFQERFFVFQRLEPGDVSYSVSEYMSMEGPLLKEEFEKVFKRLIRRYESLRTSFHLEKGKPVQRIHEDVEFEIEYHCAQHPHPSSFIRPFDLSRAPLLRLGFLKIEEEKHFLMFDVHHIISDGVSVGIFIKEFLALYAGKELAPLKIQFKDYVVWRKERKRKGAAKPVASVPGKENDPEVLNLPIDFPRPAAVGFEGETVKFDLGALENALLNFSSSQEGVTLYMVLSAAFNIFLSKISGQENIVVGSPIAGRLHPDLDGIIGLFINPLVLRNYPSGQKRFSDFLREVKENALDAYENQDYQYDELVEKINLARDTGRNPLYDVMFVMQNFGMPAIAVPGLKITRDVGENRTSKFDITLYCEEREDREHLLFRWEYSTALFKQKTIQRFIRCFKKLLAEIVENPREKIADMDILPGEDRQQILYDFNDTAVVYPRDKMVYRLVAEQSEKTPGKIAVTVQGAGQGQSLSISYRELNETSNRLARLLRSRGIKPGTIVGIMMGRRIETIIAVQGILKAGGAYLPIDPQYPVKRILSMLESVKTPVVLTESRILAEKSFPSLSRDRELLPLDRLTGELEKQCPGKLEPPGGHSPEDLIYIIFTSGSTGTPKGAGVYHRGFMNLMHWFVTDFKLTAQDCNLWLTSLSFDLTQKNLYAPLMVGGMICIPGLSYFDPAPLLRDIHDNRVTWINCTPSMFYRLVEHEEAGSRKKLSLLRYVFLGGEPISMPLLIEWLESDGHNAQIVNTYGPTECTDICASYRIERPREFMEQNIPVGKPVYNVQLFILDKSFHPAPVGVPGELLIGGEGVGTGYLNDPGLTAEKFLTAFTPRPSPFTLHPSPIYKTGDLVKWLPDGAVEFLGRIDHQVKVRGFRIELGEIENQLSGYPGIKETVVMARGTGGGDKYLCAYIVPHAGEAVRTAEVRDYLSSELPGYMVPAYLTILEKMPLNPNGKIDRKALPEPGVTSAGAHVPPRDEREKVLAAIWSQVLDLDKKQIGIHDNFFQLGGHSLKATALSAKIHKTFNIKLPLEEIFKRPTITGIAGYIKETAGKNYPAYVSLEPLEKRDYYRLSSAQKRLYILQQMDREGTGYNISLPALWSGEIERDRLEDIFPTLVRRHESLRTSFEAAAHEKEPVQRVQRKNYQFKITNYDKNFIRPFDLANAPLLRVGLKKIAQTEHLLVVDMHHIISDGMSMEIIVREFMQLYNGEALAPLKLQYKDFAGWQNLEKEKKFIEEQGNYWRGQMGGEIPVLELPLDFERPVVQSFAGSTVSFEIDETGTAALKAFALEKGVTLYMVLLTVTFIFLAKTSGREDIIIGTPAAGRGHSDLETIIGMFVNTLPLRNYPTGEKKLHGFLQEIKENTLTAFENQDYPYEELVEQVIVNRDAGRNPLFDVMFVLQTLEMPQLENSRLKLTPSPYESNRSKFDLTVIGQESKGTLMFQLEYCTRLFKGVTIARFIQYFKRIASAVPGAAGATLSELEIISPAEKSQILLDFSAPGAYYTRDKTIRQLFEEQVEKTPNHIAVTAHRQAITYRELNRNADRLAHNLYSRGAGENDLVGIMVERSLEMIIGILGILNAGCAYVPLNPGAPEARTKYIMEECGTKILLTMPDISRAVKEGLWDSPLPGGVPEGRGGFAFAYVIFTSGSTGKPKGVLITHDNICPLLHWGYKHLDLNSSAHVLQNLPYYFDWSVWEIFITLTSGSVLYTASEDVLLNPAACIEFMQRHDITVLHITPTQFQATANAAIDTGQRLETLKHLYIGAEKLTYGLVERSLALVGEDCRVINMYGPTEATIMSAVLEIEKPGYRKYKEISSIPIGRPISNAHLLVLDKYLVMCPANISGELYIGGSGLSTGYLNNPQLTAERFYRSYKSYSTNISKKIYKTGDRTRWLPDGSIEFLGRIDQQVKIRGFRIEPGEIEKRLSAHEKIKDAAVIVTGKGGGGTGADKYLCAYLVADNDLDIPGLKRYLAMELPGYMIPPYYVKLAEMPLNPNGKIAREALPEPGISGSLQAYAPPRNEIEKKLVRIWRQLLTVEKIGIYDDFFSIGGHSLKVLNLVNAIQKEFDVKMNFQDIFRFSTVASLYDLIRQSKRTGYSEIGTQEEKEYYGLSYSQLRLWLLHRLEPDSPAFNLPASFTLYEAADGRILREVLEKLVKRHESFRTYFKTIGGQAVQIIRPEGRANLEIVDLSSLDANDRDEQRGRLFKEESKKPFKLEIAPLFRTKLIKCREKEFDVILTMHHIISDGWSVEILEHEFALLYEACKKSADDTIEPLRIQYKDYVYWHNRLLADKEKMRRAKEFWENQLQGELSLPDLPYDFSKENLDSKASAGYRTVIPGETIRGLEKIAREGRASLFMVILAGFNLLLSRQTGGDDIVLAVPGAARQHDDLKNIIGLFVNTLVLRNKVDPDEPFTALLERVQKNTLQVLEYQGYPLELICREFKIKYPGISVFFNMSLFGNTLNENLENDETYHIEYVQEAKFDIVCYLGEYKNGIEITVHYYKELFKPGTIEEIMRSYKIILEDISNEPGKKSKEYSISKTKRKLNV